jgi:elongation factor G
VPRIVLLNKLDRPGASVESSVELMRTRLGTIPILIQMAVGVSHPAYLI